jgi:hypothetical protein
MTDTKFFLFGSGLIQVLLVGLNTYQIAHEKWIGAFIVGFLISFVWTFNVKKIAFGTMTDRIIYASGAAFGTTLGLIIAQIIYV